MPSLSKERPTPSPKEPKVAMVTGASKRIGRAIAIGLAEQGWDVGLHVREDANSAKEVVETIKTKGRQAAVLIADLAKDEEAAALISRCAEQLGPVTCLINNASLFEEDEMGTLSPELWAAHLDINLKSPVFLAQSLLNQLPENTTGNIINIIDQRVWRLTPEFFSYTISKSALWTATRTMALSMAPRVRVNAIGPGPVLQSIHQTEADFAAEVASVPLQRGAKPEEIALGVMTILNTPAMTGQMIALDGGQHLL